MVQRPHPHDPSTWRRPYVRRMVVYSIPDYECGHFHDERLAYEEVARLMIEKRHGYVRLGATDSEYEARERLATRLARWLMWGAARERVAGEVDRA
jgi:hypothetical protein